MSVETIEGQETEGQETEETGRKRGRGRRAQGPETPETGGQETGDGETGETGETGDGETEGQETEATTKTRKSTKASDIAAIGTDRIEAADLAENLSTMLQRAAAPVHARSEQQVAMDGVAKRAYAKWVAKGRPSAWGKMPVVTYFLDPEEVEHWKYLIRRAVEVVDVIPVVDSDGNKTSAPAVRYKFGNEVTLSEAMAEKIDHPDAIPGRVVLTWAAIDKRGTAKASETDETGNGDGDGEDETDTETDTETETGDGENGDGETTE